MAVLLVKFVLVAPDFHGVSCALAMYGMGRSVIVTISVRDNSVVVYMFRF